MGWTGGSILMNELIEAFQESFSDVDIPDESVIKFWTKVITAFEDEDWDTQEESFQENSLWDKAYLEHNPEAKEYWSNLEDENP